MTTAESYKAMGYDIGENHRWATPDQRQVFKPDTFENIVNEFNRFVEEFGKPGSVQGQ